MTETTKTTYHAEVFYKDGPAAPMVLHFSSAMAALQYRDQALVLFPHGIDRVVVHEVRVNTTDTVIQTDPTGFYNYVQAPVGDDVVTFTRVGAK
jgi:hypothetical protein